MPDVLASRQLVDWPKQPRAEILKDIVDSHAHPTDYKQFRDDAEYRNHAGSVWMQKVGHCMINTFKSLL